MTYPVKSPKKLIEVALPLDAINVTAAAEKLVKVGKPTNLHLWWARRPLSAARAVIFAQLVNDPGSNIGRGFRYGVNKKEAAIERKRLFKIIEDLVLWENTANEEVLERARSEIRRSWREVCDLNKDHPQADKLFDPDKLPALHDPFAGGGVIPLEAQRLGLEAYASDLNPVAVLINKAMIEIPPKFVGSAPVGPEVEDKKKSNSFSFSRSWPGVTGLSEDVRRYGAWMRAEAQKRIGHLYPMIEITAEMARERPDLKPLVGKTLTIIAWLWARTVMSPNPVFSHIAVPLVSTFILSNKEGKEVYIQPIIEDGRYRFTVKTGVPPLEAKNGTKLARGANFSCLMSGVPIEPKYIKAEGMAQKIGARMMAIVADGPRGRVYLPPTTEMEGLAHRAEPSWQPEGSLVEDPRAFTPTLYGLNHWRDLFTPRQLVALTTFCDLIDEARQQIRNDAIRAGMDDDGKGLEAGGSGATSYAESVSLYLAFAMTRMADWGNSLCRWEPKAQVPQQLFGRQAIPMVWDFCETNVLSTSTGSYAASIANIEASFKKNSADRVFRGIAFQADAQTQNISKDKFVSTDPPYYDNIPYADLSDFFYIWLRRALRTTFTNLLSTIAVPKAEELVATSYRHGGKDEAESFFLKGMTSAMQRLANQAHPAGPITIYYAFKQTETDSESGTMSTGWVTFLEAVINAGLLLTGTWPLRTENSSRMRGQSSNALASSIVLVCRNRPSDAPTVSRREFLRELNGVLPEALDEMTKGSGEDRSPVAPVDLSQAIIGPGMAVFSKYAAVLEADGSPMSVRTALQLINRFLAEDDFDSDTQFCLHWFEQYNWREGLYGEADVLARSKATSVAGLAEAGVLVSGGGKVRLFKWAEYPANWDPRADKRLPIWEALHHIIRAHRQGGDSAASLLLAPITSKAEAVRQLAYRLYTLCERLGHAEDARAYNELITSWTGIEAAANAASQEEQGRLFDS
jgi:putative DNA methylase